jgi:hypothetical protein
MRQTPRRCASPKGMNLNSRRWNLRKRVAKKEYGPEGAAFSSGQPRWGWMVHRIGNPQVETCGYSSSAPSGPSGTVAEEWLLQERPSASNHPVRHLTDTPPESGGEPGKSSPPQLRRGGAVSLAMRRLKPAAIHRRPLRGRPRKRSIQSRYGLGESDKCLQATVHRSTNHDSSHH